MKIDRILFALNNNPTYTSFWNVFGPVWVKKYNVIPTLIFVGSEKELEENNFSREFGEIFRIDPVEEVIVNKDLDWSVTWSLFWGATLFPEDTCMTCGIDQLMLTDKFVNLLKPISDNKYVIGFSDAYKDYSKEELGYFCESGFYPSSHNVAKGKVYKDIFEIEDSWEEEIKKVFYYGRDRYPMKRLNKLWGLDECYASEKIVEFDSKYKTEDSIIVYLEIFNNFWKNSRIDRGGININYNTDLLRKGLYSELHSPRPYEKNKLFIDKIVKDYLNE